MVEEIRRSNFFITAAVVFSLVASMCIIWFGMIH